MNDLLLIDNDNNKHCMRIWIDTVCNGDGILEKNLRPTWGHIYNEFHGATMHIPSFDMAAIVNNAETDSASTHTSSHIKHAPSSILMTSPE